MKRRNNMFFYILIGVIIGIGITVRTNLTETVNASDYYIENSNSNDNYKQTSIPFINAAKKVEPATVYIYTERKIKVNQSNPFGYGGRNDPLRDFFGDQFFEQFFGHRYNSPQREYKSKALGSGVIVNPKGYIITNNHVVEDADVIKVKLFKVKKEYEAKLLGADKKSDIAILKIKSDKTFPYAKLGNSEKLEVGEWVLAIGNPFGLSHTVTAGIVSAKGRDNLRITDYEDFIQTDCSINPGNSGGPMINLRGDVIGINTAIYSQSGGNMGIGFAIPINMVKKIMTDLVNNGKVVRGYLGVQIQEVDEKLAKGFNLKNNERGALVSKVFKNSPAEKAGIKEGDVIIEFNGVKIEDTNKLKILVASTELGKKVKVKLIRDGSIKYINVKIKEMPGDFGADYSVSSKHFDKEFGWKVQNLIPSLADKYGIDLNIKGVVITAVNKTGIAFKNGLKAGDVILMLDRKRIKNIKNLEKALAGIKNKKMFLIQIQRGDGKIFMMMEK